MTLKMIAIGVLALLGISSVMSPKAFRIFLGGLGTLCLVLFLGLVTNPRSVAPDSNDGGLLTQVYQLIGWQPAWQEENTAQRILNDIRQGRLRAAADAEASVNTRSKTNVRPRATVEWNLVVRGETNEERMASAIEGIRKVKQDYLRWMRQNSNSVGLARLTPDTLPLLPSMFSHRRGQKQDVVTLVFNDEFKEFVQLRGKQLETKERLRLAGVIAGAVSACLFLAYGILKVVNGRRGGNSRDFLETSEISMV